MANTTLYRATDEPDRLVGSFWTTDPHVAAIWAHQGDCQVLTATIDARWGTRTRHDGYFTNVEGYELQAAHEGYDFVWGTDHVEGISNESVCVLTEHGADAFRQGNVVVAANAKEFRFHPCGECVRWEDDCLC